MLDGRARGEGDDADAVVGAPVRLHGADQALLAGGRPGGQRGAAVGGDHEGAATTAPHEVRLGQREDRQPVDQRPQRGKMAPREPPDPESSHGGQEQEQKRRLVQRDHAPPLLSAGTPAPWRGRATRMP